MYSLIICVLLGANFLCFIIGALILFEKPKDPDWKLKTMSLTIILSMIGEIAMIHLFTQVNLISFLLGGILILASLSIFLWTAKWSTQKATHTLNPIYSIENTNTIHTKGPFKYVRHPFYTSYLLSFLGVQLQEIT